MKNCLVTKLKASVTNDNLSVLGSTIIPLNPYSENPNRIGIWGSVGEPFYIEIKGSGHFYNKDGTEDYGQHVDAVIKTHPSFGSVYTINPIYINNIDDGDVLMVSNKYSIQMITFEYAKYRIIKENSTPDLYYFTNLKHFDLGNKENFLLNLDEVCKYSKDLSILNIVYNKSAYGSIEKMTENLIKAGRTSGTLSILGYNSQITLNSVQFFTNASDRTTNLIITFSGNTATVTWKDNQIASYNGSTWTYNS